MRPLAICAIIVLCAAEGRAAGINLAWDHCASEEGVENKVFACDTNTGTEVLIVSFVLASDQASFVGIEATIDIVALESSLPAWWEFLNAGACRGPGVSAGFDFSQEPNESCADPWAGQATGGIGAYRTGSVGGSTSNSAQVRLVAAVPSTAPMQLAAGVEYYGLKLFIRHSRTVGPDACGGCSVPVCIRVTQVAAVQNDNTTEYLTQPVLRNVVRWQGASECSTVFGSSASSWGTIRNSYR